MINRLNISSQTDKFTKFSSQLQRVKFYLIEHNATATMTAFALNIYRPSLCRYKFELQRIGVLVVTHRAKCLATGFKADYLTCDPEKVKYYTKGRSTSLEIQFPGHDVV